jgi:uncharacterized membrane protein YebE (DUF533 family)
MIRGVFSPRSATMFNPEKLLGQLLSGGFKSSKKRKHSSGSSMMGGLLGSSVGSSVKGAAAMGMLGVGIAAFEHFMKNKSGATAAPTPNGGVLPTPAPYAAPPPPPPPPPAMVPPAASASNEPVLRLIRSMIAAAHADGVIDGSERQQIMGRLGEAGLSSDEQLFLIREMDAPWSIERLTAGISDRTYASQVYAAALLAIDADTPAETAYLERLAAALRLSAAEVAQLHADLG